MPYCWPLTCQPCAAGPSVLIRRGHPAGQVGQLAGLQLGGLLAAAPLLEDVRRVTRLEGQRHLGRELLVLDRDVGNRNFRMRCVVVFDRLEVDTLQRVSGGVVPPREGDGTAGGARSGAAATARARAATATGSKDEGRCRGRGHGSVFASAAHTGHLLMTGRMGEGCRGRGPSGRLAVGCPAPRIPKDSAIFQSAVIVETRASAGQPLVSDLFLRYAIGALCPSLALNLRVLRSERAPGQDGPAGRPHGQVSILFD